MKLWRKSLFSGLCYRLFWLISDLAFSSLPPYFLQKTCMSFWIKASCKYMSYKYKMVQVESLLVRETPPWRSAAADACYRLTLWLSGTSVSEPGEVLWRML